MATAIINGIAVSGSVEEIYQLISKATTTVSTAATPVPIVFGEGIKNAKGQL